MTPDTTDKMKILYVTTHMPRPPAMGAQIRVLNIGRKLRKLGRLTIVYVGTEPTAQSVNATKNEFDNLILMTTKKRQFLNMPDKFIHKFKFHWPWYHANKVPPTDRARFLRLCDEHDLIWFHTLPAADAFGRYLYRNSVIDIDDLAQVKYSLKLQMAANLLEKLSSKCLIYKWSRWEQRILERFSLAAVCSESDKKILGADDRICILPNGYQMPKQKPSWKPRYQMCIGFIGHLEYNPNRLGLKWFGEKIWPLITTKIPNARFRVVGKIPKDDTFLKFPGFETTGFIEDTSLEFDSWSAMVVPLQYGGGTRLKILDAFSKMCPVIATPVGAYGLAAKNNEHILIEEDLTAFANACIRLMENPDLAQHLAQNAWNLFKEKYTWDVISNQIDAIVNRIREQNQTNA